MTSIENALIAALVALMAMAGITVLGGQLGALWDGVAAAVVDALG